MEGGRTVDQGLSRVDSDAVAGSKTLEPMVPVLPDCMDWAASPSRQAYRHSFDATRLESRRWQEAAERMAQETCLEADS